MTQLTMPAYTAWPACTADTIYDYCFTVWPDEESPRMRSVPEVYTLFRRMSVSRVVMELTERQFNDFRENICKIGLVLREVERAPHLEPVGITD